MERAINFTVWGIYNLFKNGLLNQVLSNSTMGQSSSAVLEGAAFLLCAVIAYLLGSINWALVISKRCYHEDVRTRGSGNAGTTNVLRSYGKKAAIFTFLGDGLKGVVSILIACLIFGCPSTQGNYIWLVTASYFSAFFCIFGHVFPCFSHFRGGKGFATTALSLYALNPFIALILTVIFVALVLLTHYVSLGSVVVALFYPVLLSSFDRISTFYGVSTLAAFLIAALVTWAHRGNLKRIREGNERKLYIGRNKPAQSAPPQQKDSRN